VALRRGAARADRRQCDRGPLRPRLPRFASGTSRGDPERRLRRHPAPAPRRDHHQYSENARLPRHQKRQREAARQGHRRRPGPDQPPPPRAGWRRRAGAASDSTHRDLSALDDSGAARPSDPIGVGSPPLRGTLTLPAGHGPFPAVVLVSGSGQNDQDETVGPNKPFRDIALGLAARSAASTSAGADSKPNAASARRASPSPSPASSRPSAGRSQPLTDHSTPRLPGRHGTEATSRTKRGGDSAMGNGRVAAAPEVRQPTRDEETVSG
jgi:hypothetical protein